MPKIDYDKLSRDLKEANRLAVEATMNLSDGGTANLDSVVLRLPRVREIKVLEAIRNAGLYCRGKSDWLGSGYFVAPTTGGQGDKRSVSVQVMYKYLKQQGWEVDIYYQMD